MRRKRSQGPHPKSNTFTVSFTIVVIFVLFLIHIRLITVICICVSAKKKNGNVSIYKFKYISLCTCVKVYFFLIFYGKTIKRAKKTYKMDVYVGVCVRECAFFTVINQQVYLSVMVIKNENLFWKKFAKKLMTTLKIHFHKK